MTKFLMTAALAGFALSAPAFADEMMKCDDASMMKMQGMMDAMAAGDHKDMAMKEMDMAKMSMKDGKMDDCSTHMGEANKDMMMK